MSIIAQSSSSISSSSRAPSERLSRSRSLQTSITSLSSTSSLTDLSGYDSNASTPRRTSRTKRKRNPDYRSESSIYVVSHILARSFEPSIGPNNKLEYQYLVRWEGYGPNDDTWEYKTNLMIGSSLLMREFDSKPHPFTILDSRRTNTMIYLVRFCLSSEKIEPSPLSIKEWQSVTQMHRIGGLDKTIIAQAVKDFNEGIVIERPVTPRPIHLQKKRCLLAIMERRDWKKSINKKGHETRYHIRWRDGKKIREEWMRSSVLVTYFEEDGKDYLKRWNEEMGYGPLVKFNSIILPPSEYELERIQNMEANRELMKRLGLSA
ncbi:uncharacterized protein I206_104027 [Kwoniella pini CBS 10737]|uniref:Chromo domain-containing protein n=1 Tax=Kwoniella pini CBS 10737 TaxID=1296096 RepID=A0A1B9I2U0_9TREE|nr:uncharacterized protein I206_04398 [Kwoniella pini CBS 10737]OCF49870.1 hypothetical protein I206_04398 [Kwoniella pini CBS 10737]